MFRKFVAVLMLLHGIVAAYCGYAMMRDPSGGAMGLQLSYLGSSPFQDYFIPGLILHIVLGWGSIAAGVVALMNLRFYTWVLMVIGTGIIIWIATQMVMLQMLYFMQYVIGVVGIITLVIGIVLHQGKYKAE